MTITTAVTKNLLKIALKILSSLYMNVFFGIRSKLPTISSALDSNYVNIPSKVAKYFTQPIYAILILT